MFAYKVGQRLWQIYGTYLFWTYATVIEYIRTRRRVEYVQNIVPYAFRVAIKLKKYEVELEKKIK